MIFKSILKRNIGRVQVPRTLSLPNYRLSYNFVIVHITNTIESWFYHDTYSISCISVTIDEKRRPSDLLWTFGSQF